MLPQSCRIRDASEEHGGDGPSTTSGLLETRLGPKFGLKNGQFKKPFLSNLEPVVFVLQRAK